jgi:hypothetical protein
MVVPLDAIGEITHTCRLSNTWKERPQRGEGFTKICEQEAWTMMWLFVKFEVEDRLSATMTSKTKSGDAKMHLSGKGQSGS